MKLILDFLKHHSLLSGIVLMFLLTWPIDLANSGVLAVQVPFAIYIFLGWGFIFASLIMTGLTQGRPAVLALLKRFLIWRVGWKWYLVAFLLLPVIFFLGVVLNAWWSRTALDFSAVFAHNIFGPQASLPVFIVPFLIFDAITNGEEMGWRGYILPRLQSKYSALVSSLILGVIWGLWHLPKFLAPGNTSPMGLYLVKIMAEAVLYTWIYNNTHGSLLLTTLTHAAANTAGVFLPMATTISGYNTGVLLIIIALEMVAVVVVIAFSGPAQLSRTVTRQIQN
jgi:membrane protease YdiL (CAAX protease family)